MVVGRAVFCAVVWLAFLDFQFFLCCFPSYTFAWRLGFENPKPNSAVWGKMCHYSIISIAKRAGLLQGGAFWDEFNQLENHPKQRVLASGVALRKKSSLQRVATSCRGEHKDDQLPTSVLQDFLSK